MSHKVKIGRVYLKLRKKKTSLRMKMMTKRQTLLDKNLSNKENRQTLLNLQGQMSRTISIPHITGLIEIDLVKLLSTKTEA